MTEEIYRQIKSQYIFTGTVAVKEFRNTGNINPDISSYMWNVARFRNNSITSYFRGYLQIYIYREREIFSLAAS